MKKQKKPAENNNENTINDTIENGDGAKTVVAADLPVEVEVAVAVAVPVEEPSAIVPDAPSIIEVRGLLE